MNSILLFRNKTNHRSDDNLQSMFIKTRKIKIELCKWWNILFPVFVTGTRAPHWKDLSFWLHTDCVLIHMSRVWGDEGRKPPLALHISPSGKFIFTAVQPKKRHEINNLNSSWLLDIHLFHIMRDSSSLQIQAVYDICWPVKFEAVTLRILSSICNYKIYYDLPLHQHICSFLFFIFLLTSHFIFTFMNEHIWLEFEHTAPSHDWGH